MSDEILPPTRRLVDPGDYHNRPGLSASLAKILIAKSPAHAHARRYDTPTREMDRGSVIHALVLGAGKRFEVLPFSDYRTKAAQEARDKARSVGLVPIKEDDHADAVRAANAILAQLAARGIVLDGESECAIEWHEASAAGPVLCRGQLDHLWLDAGTILDLKITEDASPRAVMRSAESLGWAIQAAAYTRGVSALRSALAGRVDFMFAACEPEPPYAVNIARPDGMMRELGDRRWARAVETWGACMASGEWPAYPATTFLGVPSWTLAEEGIENE